MISTDGVKQAADELGVLDSKPIVDELNRLQSQKFVDPNCHPTPKSILDVLGDSFCDTPLDGRARRLADFMKGMPILPVLPDQSQCAQATLTKLQKLIEEKFSFKDLEENTKKSKFEEEKVESQISIVLFVSYFVYALGQVTNKVPLLIARARDLLTGTINSLNTLSIDDQVASFERKYAVDRMIEVRARLQNITKDETTYVDLIAPTATFSDYQHDMLNKFTSPIVIRNVGVFRALNFKIQYTQRKSNGQFGDVYKVVGEKMIKATQPSIDDYYTDLIDRKKVMLDGVHNGIVSSSSSGIIKRQAYYSKATADIDANGIARSTSNFLADACADLVSIFNSYVVEVPKTPTEKDVLAELSKLDMCGVKLPSVTPQQDAGDTPNSNNPADLSHNTFDDGNKPTVTELKYWKRYSVYLTLANLLPTYWTIGLYIPTPAGVVKVPLPTVWRPLFVFNAKPFGLIVIFLTINGIAISPTVWVWKFPPFAKNESSLFVMLRAFNKKIKDDTGDALLNVPVVDGINVNPVLTKRLPFKQDDLPTIRRLGLNNAPYLLYLTQWLKQYKTGGGLP